MSQPAHTPVVTALVPRFESAPARWLILLALALAGTAILTLSAKLKVPFYPVPMTMQTAAVMAIAAAYGSRLGFATVALYIAQGAIGLPVFAGTPERGIGLAYLVGPTGGYLLGFALAAFVVGWLAERGWDRNPLRLGIGMAASMVLVYGFGAAWLAGFTGWSQAFSVGVAPFLLGDVLKVALAAAAVFAVRRVWLRG